MTQAQALLDTGFAALLAVHGEPATYTPAGGSATTIQIIFDEAAVIIDPETQMVTTAPRARTWTVSASSPKDGRLAVGGVTYNIVRAEPDGLGTTMLTLSRNTMIPIAPSGLAAVLFAGVVPQLDWTRNATNNTAVEVWRATGAGAFLLIATEAAGVVQHFDNTANPATTYRYKVRNTNVSGPSPFSNEVSIAVP